MRDFNQFELTAMHALNYHPHHNPQQVVPFVKLDGLNAYVNTLFPGLVILGPDPHEHSGVGQIPGTNTKLVFHCESHMSPSVFEPYGSTVTLMTGNFRDVFIMGARPFWATNLIGSPALENKIAVGPCAYEGDGSVCICGNCKVITIAERNQLHFQGMLDACKALGVAMMAGGTSTSIKGPVPAVAATVIGVLTVDQPLRKPARHAGDKLILIGKTDESGNDTAYRAGVAGAEIMIPAKPLFEPERISGEGVLAAIQTGKVNAGSDLGAAGIVAASRESACAGGLGVIVDLSAVALTESARDISPFEIAFNETQARYALQVNSNNVDEVLEAIRSTGATANVVGEITETKEAVYTFGSDIIARIPNEPPEGIMEILCKM